MLFLIFFFSFSRLLIQNQLIQRNQEGKQEEDNKTYFYQTQMRVRVQGYNQWWFGKGWFVGQFMIRLVERCGSVQAMTKEMDKVGWGHVWSSGSVCRGFDRPDLVGWWWLGGIQYNCGTLSASQSARISAAIGVLRHTWVERLGCLDGVK